MGGRKIGRAIREGGREGGREMGGRERWDPMVGWRRTDVNGREKGESTQCLVYVLVLVLVRFERTHTEGFMLVEAKILS